jgi:hypothetical protein
VIALQIAAACLAGAAATLVVLSVRARFRFRRLPGSFRCRLGPGSRRRRAPSAWRIRRTRAVWARDVLLVQSGALRLGITPVCASVARHAAVEELEPFTTRGLGLHAVALTLTADDGRSVVVATAGRDRTTLAGPFLAAALPGLPRAPRGQASDGRGV